MFSDYNTYAQYYGLNGVGGNNGLSNGFDFRNMNSGFVDIGNDEIISFSQGVYLLKNMLNEAERKTFKLNHLLSLTNSESEKVLINQILDNHRVHDRILKDVYYRISGQMINGNFGNSNIVDDKVAGDKKYDELLKEILYDKFDCIVKLRRILSVMPGGDLYTLIMSVLTDEVINTDKILLILNSVK